MDKFFDFFENHPGFVFAGAFVINAVIFVAMVLFVLFAVKAIFF